MSDLASHIERNVFMILACYTFYVHLWSREGADNQLYTLRSYMKDDPL